MKTLWFFILCLAVSLSGSLTQAIAEEHPSGGQEHPAEVQGHSADSVTEKSPDKAENAMEYPNKKIEKKNKHKKMKKMQRMKKKARKNHSWNKQEVERDLMSFITTESSKHAGVFSVRDEIQNNLRNLSLEKIHSDKIVQLSDGTSFVCADFKDSNGDQVDVDFFMNPAAQDSIEQISKVQVHKVNGKARYTYVQTKGQWNQVATH